jgi:hypothetical protein
MTDFDYEGELEKEQLREALREASKKLVKANNKADILAQAAFDGARSAMQAMGKPKPVKAPNLSHSGPGRPEVAFWHLTDWQGAKVTTSYNSEVMRERVHRFWERAVDVTEIQRKDHPVDRVVVAAGGDMGEGLFNFPTQPYEIDMTLFGQFVNVARLFADTLLFAATVYERVDPITEWGNHGRIGDKRAAVPRSDNFDRMIYWLAKEMTSHEPRIVWPDVPIEEFFAEDIQRVEIGNYRALLIHGDEIGRNGFSSPTTIVQHVNRWRSGAYRWDFRDVYMGHYHTHAEWPLANGEGAVYQTGSTESDNRYARDTMAASAIPSQRVHFIDPEKGRVTAQYKIILEG